MIDRKPDGQKLLMMESIQLKTANTEYIQLLMGKHPIQQNNFMFPCSKNSWLLCIVSDEQVESFEEPWDGTETNVGKIAFSFYSGLFSYAGWYVEHELLNKFVWHNYRWSVCKFKKCFVKKNDYVFIYWVSRLLF